MKVIVRGSGVKTEEFELFWREKNNSRNKCPDEAGRDETKNTLKRLSLERISEWRRGTFFAMGGEKQTVCRYLREG